jgi:rhodanese-related sulfurtransferase
MTEITPRQLHERVLKDERIQLLDVRSEAEHSRVHVAGVQLAPLSEIDADTFAHESGFTKDEPIYIFCTSGNRAKHAAAKLAKLGYTQCQVVEGGMGAWIKAGLPVNRSPNAMVSLENQVRIAAGGIVLVGGLLTQFVNPAFIWLSGFVGVGLLISGFTDWCGMRLLISRMPWNQSGSDGTTP